MWSRIAAYAHGLARRRAIDAEVDEELRFHVDHETEALIARGVSPDDARRQALLALGGLAQTKDSVRAVRLLWLDSWVRDVRQAVRGLRGAPTFTLVALLVLSLSIGTSTAVYSLVDAVVLRALPFPRSDRLVSIGEAHVGDDSPTASRGVAPQNFLDWREMQRAFSGISAVWDVSISLKREGVGEPENLRAQWVTADFFAVLGVMPTLGRPFTADNEVEGRAPVAVISHGLWQRRFGGAPDIVGRRLPGQLASFEIVGVMPPSFAYPVGEAIPTEVWVPYVIAAEDRVRGNSLGHNLQVIGRLRDDVSLEQAQVEMDRITASLAAATPRWFEGRVARVIPLHDEVSRGVRTWMLTLLAAVGCVLLLACVNLANLMLVRATTRLQELRIRLALGASRRDLLRTLLSESLMLSVSGAALGVLVGWVGVDVLRSVMPAEVPRAALIGIDMRVLAAAAFTGLATGLVFGMLPAMRFSRLGGAFSRSSSRGGTAGVAVQRLRGVLVVAQVALALVLLVGAGLFLASFARVSGVPLGFEPAGVLSVRVRPLVGPSESEEARRHNRDKLLRILNRVETLPGIESAAVIGSSLPLRGDLRTVRLAIPGQSLPQGQDIALNEITPDYLSVLRIPVLRGRGFTAEDRQGSEPVVLLSDAAARRYFADGDAIGKVVELDTPRTVVGVVGSVRDEGPEHPVRVQAYVPVAQRQLIGATLVMRTAPGVDVRPAVREAIWVEFPDVPIPDQFTLAYYYDRLIAQRRFLMLLTGLFGAVAVVIASAGIYGVMAYLVAERTREIGVRMAVGAAPAAVLRMVLARATAYVGGGLALGFPLAWAVSRTLEAYLYDIRPHDPLVYAAVLSALVATALCAAYAPARRAAHIDPMEALRPE
jgi:predicted permease